MKICLYQLYIPAEGEGGGGKGVKGEGEGEGEGVERESLVGGDGVRERG